MSAKETSDWLTLRLGDIGQSLIGLTYSPSNVSQSGTLVLRSSNIQDGRLSFDDNVYVRAPVPEKIKIRERDILICVRNGSRRLIGKSVMLDHRVAGQTFGAFMAVYRSPYNQYLQYFFESDIFKRQVDEHLGATINQITNASLNSFVVALPDSAEQAAIASKLADADRYIGTLERLITKKQAIKQGMMQQLLTGKTRLPGFGHAWRQTQVGELLDFKNGLNKASQYFGKGTPIVNFMDVMHGPIIAASDVTGLVTLTRDEIRRFSARRGDIFFTRTSETVDEVGTAAALVDDIPDAVFSGFILRGRPRKSDTDSRFLALLFQLGVVRMQVTATATYTTRALTNGRSLSRVTVELPSLDEQRAIADVIADSDAEIAALKVSLDKAQAVKKGMMQQLLTCRTRLPVEKEAA